MTNSLAYVLHLRWDTQVALSSEPQRTMTLPSSRLAERLMAAARRQIHSNRSSKWHAECAGVIALRALRWHICRGWHSISDAAGPVAQW